MNNNTRNAALRMLKRHIRKMYGIDGTVSDPINTVMEHPDGTRTLMVAYKLTDSHQPDFWVAVEKLKEL